MIIKTKELDGIEMKNEFIDRHISEMKTYYSMPAGQEHYRLLVSISRAMEDSTILDIGTYEGASAMALANNPKNDVHSYNIVDQRKADFSDIPNITFSIKNIYDENKQYINSARLILFDISPHDGVMEMEFYNFIKTIEYTGIVIFDDVNLNDGMKSFWENLPTKNKIQTEHGHSSGTGIVYFGNERINFE